MIWSGSHCQTTCSIPKLCKLGSNAFFTDGHNKALPIISLVTNIWAITCLG